MPKGYQSPTLKTNVFCSVFSLLSHKPSHLSNTVCPTVNPWSRRVTLDTFYKDSEIVYCLTFSLLFLCLVLFILKKFVTGFFFLKV